MLSDIAKNISRFIEKIERMASYSQIKYCKKAGCRITLGKNVKIENPECVVLGDNVHINDYVWISIPSVEHILEQDIKDISPELIIGDNSYVGRFGTIACVTNVCIGRDVLISDRVYIGDSVHNWHIKNIPIKEQGISSPGPIVIGNGTWVGINVSILPNVTIGKNCVIGANSVVTKSIPDFSVYAGNPARSINRNNK